ncbi:transcriptional regulator [Flavobacterium branchiophilum]|uniref:Transcriptional regulator n=1 Tax=Flavobacterium branchiophilum TaxID=55197 RepID=A0A2H3KC64_9FLAO|nr:transcriptional regulator [Flavobacterium branchiophilum]PDS24841.1 transcriptional regulator [Flavobacterium branchiophilum]
MKNLKHNLTNNTEFPANGNFVHYYLNQNKISKADVARKLEVNHSTVLGYLKQQSLQFGVLWRLSKVLDYNFVAHLGEYLKIPYQTKAEQELQATIEQQNAHIQTLETEIRILRGLQQEGKQ